MKDNLLNNKVILVTGGAGLIGKEFIKAIADEGGITIIGDINEEASIKAQNELISIDESFKIDFFKLDIISKKNIEKVISKIVEKYGKIDALVNNAYPRNKNYGKDFLQVEYKDFCENVNIHLGGYFLMSQRFGDFFIKQGFGNIVNIASIYGVIAPRFEIYEGTNMTVPVEYAVIKSSIIHLTKYLAKYFKGKNIRVNSISPGGIFDNQPEGFINAYNEFTLNKGMLNKNDIIGSLIFLLSDMSKYVNGQNIIVDDGFTL